jgi:uncharacterized protein (TIGR02466 family)
MEGTENRMKARPIHYMGLYGETILNLDESYIKQVRDSIELLRRGDVEGRMVSNVNFGWQSGFLPQTGPFEKLTQKICTEAFDFCKNLKKFEFKKIVMAALWANINYKGDINWPHNHGGDLAGVFYLNPSKNCGNLNLVNFQYARTGLGNYLDNENTISIEPKKNKLILFNAPTYHFVEKNFSDKIRISISFNLDILKEQ